FNPPSPRSTPFPYSTLFRSDLFVLLLERTVRVEADVERTGLAAPDVEIFDRDGGGRGVAGQLETRVRHRLAGALVVHRHHSGVGDRKSTRLISSNVAISCAV